MRKRLVATLIAAFCIPTMSFTPVMVSASTGKCKAILANHPNGVAKSQAAAREMVALGYAKPAVSAGLYASARKLDKFKDGTACVYEANKRSVLPGLSGPETTSSNEPQVVGNPAVSPELSSAVANLGGTCIVAMRDGKIIGEWYSGGRTANTRSLAFSSTKPLTGAVVGAAQHLGRLRLDQSISDFIPEYKDSPKASITVRHLLTHRSGLQSSNVEGISAMQISAGTSTKMALSLPLIGTPGSTWDYESSVLSMQLLLRVVERAVGENFRTFAEKYVLRPVGMSNSAYKGDEPKTNWDTGDPWLAGGLNTTCRDLARLGQLYQQGGLWAGQTIFSREYAAQATGVQVNNAVFGAGITGNTYGLLLNHNWGGIGHGGACGQILITMPSGVTVASMSSSTMTTPLLSPDQCSNSRLARLTQAVLKIANLQF